MIRITPSRKTTNVGPVVSSVALVRAWTRAPAMGTNCKRMLIRHRNCAKACGGRVDPILGAYSVHCPPEFATVLVCWHGRFLPVWVLGAEH